LLVLPALRDDKQLRAAWIRRAGARHPPRGNAAHGDRDRGDAGDDRAVATSAPREHLGRLARGADAMLGRGLQTALDQAREAALAAARRAHLRERRAL